MTREEFRTHYKECLIESVAKAPDEFPWNAPGPRHLEIDTVTDRVIKAIEAGSVSLSDTSRRALAKRLNCKPTYKAIFVAFASCTPSKAYQDGPDFYAEENGRRIASYPQYVKKDQDIQGAKSARAVFELEFPKFEIA